MTTSGRTRVPAVTLLRVEAGTLPWATMGGAVALAAAALAATRPWASGVTITAVRLLALLLAAGMAFAVEDAASVTVASSPTALPARRAARGCVVLAGALATLVVLVGVGAAVSDAPLDLPVAALAVEVLALFVAGLAVASTPVRGAGVVGGAVAASALLAGAVTAVLVQAQEPALSLFPAGPQDASWRSAHAAWTVILVVAGVWLARASRDPGSNRTGRSPTDSRVPGEAVASSTP